jgi:ribonuclease HI
VSLAEESLEWRSLKEALARFSAAEVRALLGRRAAVVAYTDGACVENPGGPAGWSAILLPVDDLHARLDELPAERIECHGHIPPASTTTNNRAEITAVLAALSLTPPDRPLNIYSDSEYTIKVASGLFRAKANRDLWELFHLLAQHRTAPLHFEWVRGHAGQVLNERADELAGLGAWRDDRAAYERWLASQRPEARNGLPSAERQALLEQAQGLQALFASGQVPVKENERQFVDDLAKRLRRPDFVPTEKQRNWLKGLLARYAR